jgi:outer membrane protein W
MKKKIVASIFVFAIFVLVFNQAGFAQDMEGKFGIGASVAYIYYSNDQDLEPDEDVMYGGNLTYFVQEYLSLELSVNYVETDVYLGGLGDFNIGELEQIPILLSLRGHLSTDTKVIPYATVGVGYYFNDFDMDSSIPAGYDLDPDDSFGFHLGGGVEYFFNEHFAFNCDFKFMWSNVDFDGTAPGGITIRDKKVDVDTFTAGVGFKYYF